MTNTRSQKRVSLASFQKIKRYFTVIFLIFSVVILIKYSTEVNAAIISGINLAVRSIIPSLFPFLILSDVFIREFSYDMSILGRAFSKIFGLPPAAFAAFLCGAFSGFPIGVKCATDLYSRGEINKEDLERLIGFVNNPSPAFVISAVGTMRGSTRDGIILYFAVIVAAIFTGIFFSKRTTQSYTYRKPYKKSDFNLAASIKNAAYTSIVISAYIIFFSALLGAINALFEQYKITLILSVFLEIGNGASLLSKSSLDPIFSLTVTAFALGFSGFSVHMQAKSLLPEETSMKKYFFMKFTEGMIAALIILLVTKLT